MRHYEALGASARGPGAAWQSRIPSMLPVVARSLHTAPSP